MGIKNFAKVFLSSGQIKLKDLKGKTLAIDAMTELYRSALGAKSISTLTDKYGSPTLHINVILANVIEMHRCGINQIWVFDHDKDSSGEFHNPAKMDELLRRKQRKTEAKAKLDTLFSDSDNDSDSDKANSTEKAKADKADKADKKHALEKQTFTADKKMIDDVKLILNCLNIRYVEAPEGFEGEHIASYLSATDQVDAVYSGDTDPIPFGAKVLYRRNPKDKKIYEYTQTDILEQIKEKIPDIEPTYDDMLKICIALGCDFAPKTPGIGAKTVLDKFHRIKLVGKQIDAINDFKKEPTDDIEAFNMDKTPFENDNREFLIKWLVEERSFSRQRINGWFEKVDATTKPKEKPKAKPKAKSTTTTTK